MDYFAVQVWTGHESDYAEHLANDSNCPATVAVPKRAMQIRKLGKIKKEERPVFPGYVFIPIPEGTMDPALRWVIRSTKYFVRLLPTTGDPKPIQEKDRRILAHFMSFGKVADTSKVVFDENERIVVIEGPLKGLEGSIIKINKRKGRAKVSLDMCESSFLIDLSFEILDRSAKGSGSENGQQP
jgi:transcription termination/antitermination protein NusG